MIKDSLFSNDECRVRDPLYFTSRPETRLVEQASLDLLDSHRLHFYLEAREADNPSLARCSRPQQMHMLGLSCDGIPTVAAMMHFCPYPQGFFPRFQLLCAVIDAPEWTDQEELQLLKKPLNGSISELYDQAMALCREYGADYPQEVLAELIMNALIHRDYSPEAAGIASYLVFFSNHIEIWNPIGRDTFSLQERRGGSMPERPNPTIASIAQVLMGTPLQGKGLHLVQKQLENAGLPELKYHVEDQELCMSLYKAEPAAEDVTDQLLSFCRTPRSRQEIADFLHVGTVFYAMQRYVRPLLESGQLIMTLPEKPQSSHQRFVKG